MNLIESRFCDPEKRKDLMRFKRNRLLNVEFSCWQKTLVRVLGTFATKDTRETVVPFVTLRYADVSRVDMQGSEIAPSTRLTPYRSIYRGKCPAAGNTVNGEHRGEIPVENRREFIPALRAATRSAFGSKRRQSGARYPSSYTRSPPYFARSSAPHEFSFPRLWPNYVWWELSVRCHARPRLSAARN